MTLGDIDKDVQSYLKPLRKASTSVSIPLAFAAATGLVAAKDAAKDKTQLKQHGGHLELKRSWSVFLMERMCYVQWQGTITTQSKRKLSDNEFLLVKHVFITQIRGMIDAY